VGDPRLVLIRSGSLRDGRYPLSWKRLGTEASPAPAKATAAKKVSAPGGSPPTLPPKRPAAQSFSVNFTRAASFDIAGVLV
jgi:hypothetical protein